MGATEEENLLVEPLLHNPPFPVQVGETPSVQQRMVLDGTTRIRDFLDYSWNGPQRMGFPTMCAHYEWCRQPLPPHLSLILTGPTGEHSPPAPDS